MYKIEKNIPIPEYGKKSEFVIFLQSMEIGDSALIDWDSFRNVHSYAKVAGIKIKRRAKDEVYRIWRTA